MENWQRIISAHESEENERKKLVGKIITPPLSPRDWGYNLQTGLIPN